MSTFRIQQLNYLHQGKRICLLIQGRNPFLAGHVWSPGVFWWLRNQFLSFCLGQDWNPSSFNTSANSAGELHGHYPCGPSQPAPDTSPALPGAKSNTTDGFLPGLSWASLSSVHEWANSSTRSPEVTSALHTLVCTHYSQPPKSECPSYTLGWCLPLDIYVSQGQNDHNDIWPLLTRAKLKPVISSLAACPISRF